MPGGNLIYDVGFFHMREVFTTCRRVPSSQILKAINFIKQGRFYLAPRLSHVEPIEFNHGNLWAASTTVSSIQFPAPPNWRLKLFSKQALFTGFLPAHGFTQIGRRKSKIGLDFKATEGLLSGIQSFIRR
jgi:hypothetical protein